MLERVEQKVQPIIRGAWRGDSQRLIYMNLAQLEVSLATIERVLAALLSLSLIAHFLIAILNNVLQFEGLQDDLIHIGCIHLLRVV